MRYRLAERGRHKFARSARTRWRTSKVQEDEWTLHAERWCGSEEEKANFNQRWHVGHGNGSEVRATKGPDVCGLTKLLRVFMRVGRRRLAFNRLDNNGPNPWFQIKCGWWATAKAVTERMRHGWVEFHDLTGNESLCVTSCSVLESCTYDSRCKKSWCTRGETSLPTAGNLSVHKITFWSFSEDDVLDMRGVRTS